MAEVTTSNCCAPEAQQTCCEPSEKAACCETSAAGGSCGCAAGETTTDLDADVLRETIRERYAAAALAGTDPTAVAGCCSNPAAISDEQAELFGAGLYASGEQDELPDTALHASLGCGNPTAMADLHEGETVLDLGSGGGIDVLLSARRVGPTGTAYGLDMTDEMLELARANQAKAAIENVHWLKGHIEAIPLPDDSVDVVISNCVINLSPDKPAVFAEVFRVLRVGGRFGVADVVVEDRLSEVERSQRTATVGCIVGALSFGEYVAELGRAGFAEIGVTSIHDVGGGVHSAIVRATKPAAP